MTLLQFPVRRLWRACAGCGLRFSPTYAWHTLCYTCFNWARAAVATAAAARFMRRVREGYTR
ncbi:MAG: hypothetical protein L0177_13845 [Chloroflexi bacterium]|nr:hypothetical protein [Chloroflexota bacterium]